MSFQTFNFDQEILDAIDEMGYTDATPVQEQAIPLITQGSDLRASAQTGTGKTAAFLLPTIQKILDTPRMEVRGPKVLILVPTRELATQVAAETQKYTKFLKKVKTVCIFGGAPYPVQNRQLANHYDILVATPGRLIDHLERGRIDLSGLKMLILDEADRMLDMGFIEPVEHIASLTPDSRQTLLFSATLKGPVMKLSQRLLKDPKEVQVAASHDRHENIAQHLHMVDDLNHKHRLLDQYLTDQDFEQAIIFTSTKAYADELVFKLRDDGHRASALHGDMNQGKRNRTISQMRKGSIRILVATDVAARGIDVQSITHVINFDLPHSPEDYVHRIGRTGRAGAKGTALSFASPKDMRLVSRIEEFTGQSIPSMVIPGMESRFTRNTKMPGSKHSRFKSRSPRRDGGRSGSRSPRREGARSDSKFFKDDGDRSRSRPPRREGARSESRFPRREGGRSESKFYKDDSDRSRSRPPRREGARSESRFPKREGGRSDSRFSRGDSDRSNSKFPRKEGERSKSRFSGHDGDRSKSKYSKKSGEGFKSKFSKKRSSSGQTPANPKFWEKKSKKGNRKKSLSR